MAVNLDAAAQAQMRKDLESWCRHIGPCDGLNKELLRAWIEKIDNIRLWLATPDQILIPKVVSLAANPLASLINQEAERRHDNQEVLTWENLKEVIVRNHLSVDERDYLRQSLDNLR